MDNVSKEGLYQGLVINDRYRLAKLLGTGSFGQVWRTMDTATGEEIALKIYIPLDSNGIDMFKREYLITKKFRHPNLLSTDHFDKWGQRPFLTMQYCSRGSAVGLIGKIDESQLWRFLRDVGDGLAYLHARNVVHQDIKPDNILIDEDGNFLITDFGISKQLKATMRAQSTTMSGAGSLSYMGPERFASAPQTLPASDIWSLGAALCHLACGEPPFNGMGGGMQRHGAELPELPSKFSRRLNTIMQSCLALEPAGRPQAGFLARIVPTCETPVPPPIPTVVNQTILDADVEKVQDVSSGQPPLPPPLPLPVPPPLPKNKVSFFGQLLNEIKEL